MRAAYRHVFGNAYLMEEERAELAVPESQYKAGNITAREFVRRLAKSEAYKKRFFEGASQYRFVELNYMHLLGRAPDSHEEIARHIQLYLAKGVDADIDSYIDSEEYETVFGEDSIPFLRFRGAYTPSDSFNKQCALKGGWANSDKAMGGAALFAYNGSDGRQSSENILSYISKMPTPYEKVAENTPLKTTAPNWYACPDPALAPKPGFVSVAEVRGLEEAVRILQAQYEIELAKRISEPKDKLSSFRSMVRDMGPMLDRGLAYSGGDPLLANPFARLMSDDSPLTNRGAKASAYKQYSSQLETNTLSRLERDLEVAKASLRVLSAALSATNPMNPPIQLPGQGVGGGSGVALIQAGGQRPRVSLSSSKPKLTPVVKKGIKIGPFQLPPINLPSISISLPFKKK